MLLLIVADGHQSLWTQFVKFLKMIVRSTWFVIGLCCVILGIGIPLVCCIIFRAYNQRPQDTMNIELFPVSTHRGVDDTEESNQEECTICIEPYLEGDHIRMLPCSHVFHESCIIEWLRRSRTCPICRRPL